MALRASLKILPSPRQCLHCWVPCRTGIIFDIFSPKRTFDRDLITKIQQEVDLRPVRIKSWFKKKERALLVEDHRFIEERHRTLGPDLATAHFAVARQATVKFVGIDDWVKIEDPKQKYVNLPGNYIPDLYLEAVDASGTQMLYESFDNFVRLEHLKYLNLSRCENIDDFCLDRFVQFSDSLLYLDLSECSQVTERGLACLHRLEKLKRLRIANMPSVKNPTLVALMLEEAIPGCVVEGIDYSSDLENTNSPTDKFMASIKQYAAEAEDQKG
ncbi:Distal membrane-arm assembly complex protein 2 [Lamellibrachia satsuma]|nr:Distal membrane-arm assembly complex protein 2 [Lamellibrachia satsuma]